MQTMVIAAVATIGALCLQNDVLEFKSFVEHPGGCGLDHSHVRPMLQNQMRCQRWHAAGDGPNVQIVERCNTWNLKQGGLNRFMIQALEERCLTLRVRHQTFTSHGKIVPQNFSRVWR